MIGYVGVQEQVDKDFHLALLKASLHRWKDRLRRDLADEHLLSFDEAKGALAQWGQAYGDGWVMRQMPASVLRKSAVSKTSPYLLSSLLRMFALGAALRN